MLTRCVVVCSGCVKYLRRGRVLVRVLEDECLRQSSEGNCCAESVLGCLFWRREVFPAWKASREGLEYEGIRQSSEGNCCAESVLGCLFWRREVFPAREHSRKRKYLPETVILPALPQNPGIVDNRSGRPGRYRDENISAQRIIRVQQCPHKPSTKLLRRLIR